MSHFVIVMVEDGKNCAPTIRYITMFMRVLFSMFHFCPNHCSKNYFQGIISGAYNFGKLAISPDALHSSYHAKVQLLLILIETLDLEILLQMVHDEVPFRFLTIWSFFSVCLSVMWQVHRILLSIGEKDICQIS